MKKRFFQIGFVVSVVFNIAAMTAVVYSLYFAKPVSSNKPNTFAAYDRLNLSDEQKHELWNRYMEMVRGITASQQQYKTKWVEVVQMISAPQPDWKAIEAKQSEILDINRETQTMIFQRWDWAKSRLSPEQQRLFFELLQERIKSGELLGEIKTVQEIINKNSTQPETK
ncbi:MAG: Spy/CpxP family protein refolding chaperone [Blastocatellia bacterium]